MFEELQAEIEKKKKKDTSLKDRLFNAAKETFVSYKTELLPQSVQATKDIVQGTARGVVGTLASIGNKVLMEKDTTYKPTTKFEEKVFGTNQPFGYQSEYQDIGEAGAEFIGVENETLKKVVGAPIGVGLFALDVLPGGKGAKKVIQESIEEGRSVVRATAPELEEVFAKDILEKTKGLSDIEKVKSIVKEETLKYTTPQTLDEIAQARKYIDEFVDIQEKARKGEGELPSTFSKGVKDVKRKFVDFASPIEDTLFKAQKDFKFSLLPSEDITNQIDTVLRAPVVATRFIKNNGLDDVINSFPSEKELVDFDQYLLSKHSIDLDTRGIETGRELIKDQAIVKAFARQFEDKAQKVISYAQRLLDYVTERGLISKELNTQLKNQYPNYVPFSRIFSEIEKETMPALFSKKGVASLGKQSVVQKISGSTRAVENPIDSLLAKTYDAVYQAEKNKAAAMIASYKDLPGNPFQLKALRTTDDVLKRIDIYSEVKELKPIQDKVKKMLSSSSKEVRQLLSEINKLNKQGVKVATSKIDEFLPKKVSGVETKISLELFKENAPKSFDELSNSFSAKDLLQKEFQTFDLLKQEIHMGGYSRLVELGFDKSTAESVAKQIFKNPTYKPQEVVSESIIPIKLSNKEAKEFVGELIKDKSNDLELIKRKIGNREPKVKKLIEDIANLREEFYGIKDLRKGLLDEASLIKDVESKGKAVISFFENGVKNIYETTPEIAAAAKALNVQQLGLLEKIFALPVRVAKLGITSLNPSFALSNVSKDQLTAFINANGGIRKSLANPMVTVKALFAALNHNKLYDEAADALAVGTSFDIARDQMVKTVAEIRSGRSFASKIKYLATNPKQLLRTAEDIIGRSEEFTRIQQFEATRRNLTKSLGDVEARIAAGRAARENTANFYRRGEYGTAMNAALLYMNASIQGARSFIRAFKKSPKDAATKLVVGLFFPVLVLTAINLKNEKRKEIYDDIEEFEKENNIIFVPENATKDKSGRWNVVKVPLPPHLAKLASIPRKMLEGSLKIDPAGAGYIFEQLLGSVSPIEMDIQKAIGQLTPQFIKPSIESLTNTNLFTGLPIVPESMKDLSPELQYKDYTSGTARIAGKALNVSPLKAEQWIKSTFGGLSSQILNAVDTVLAGVEIIPKDQIGGKGVLEAISDRFMSAQGGATERKVVDKLSVELQRVADENFRITEKAEVLYAELSQMDKAEANAKALEIKKQDKKLFEELKDLIEKEKKGLDYSDRLLLRLPVEDGTRAKYIYTLLKSMETDQEKNEYLKEMKKKKVISDKVLAQIKYLKSKGE